MIYMSITERERVCVQVQSLGNMAEALRGLNNQKKLIKISFHFYPDTWNHIFLSCFDTLRVKEMHTSGIKKKALKKKKRDGNDTRRCVTDTSSTQAKYQCVMLLNILEELRVCVYIYI